MRRRLRQERQRRRHAVLVLADRFRQGRPTAGHRFVLQRRQQDRGQQSQRRRGRRPRKLSSPNAPPHLRQKKQRHREEQENRLVLPDQQVQPQPRAQQHSISHPAAYPQSRKRAEHQASRRRREAPAAVAVGPLVQRSELDHRQHAAQKRPPRRRPPAQHPIAERAERRSAHQNPRPGQAEDAPPDHHREPLPHRINRAVRRLLQHEKGLEELRQRVWRIGQPEVPQRVGNQQVPELVIEIGRRHRMMTQQQQSQRHRQNGKHRHAQPRAPRNPQHTRLDRWAPHQRRHNQQHTQAKQQEIRGSEADRIGAGQQRPPQVLEHGNFHSRRSSSLAS